MREQSKLNIGRRRLGVEVTPPGLPLLVETHLHLLEDLRRVADDQLDGAAGLLQELDGLLVMLAFNGDAVDGQQLVAALEASHAVSNSTWKRKNALLSPRRAAVTAQLEEQTRLTIEICGSNPTMSTILSIY